MRPSKKELLAKSLFYRGLVILYELILGLIATVIGLNILEFVAVNNVIKIFGYFVAELIWVGYLHTRWRLVERLIIRRVRKTLK